MKSSDETLKLSSLVRGDLCPCGLEGAGLGPLPLSTFGAKRSVWTRFLARVGQLWPNRSGLLVCRAHPKTSEMPSLVLACSICSSVTESCLTLRPHRLTHQAPLSATVSRSLLRFLSVESVMLSNHLTLCHPLLLLPSVFPITRVFSSESARRFRL